MKFSAIGLDLAKNVFPVYGITEDGEIVKKVLRRKQVVEYFAQLEAAVIGLEACGSAHYWARELMKLGHTVKLINPRLVKPYVKGNKNDFNDAEAIFEAVTRPNLRFVAGQRRWSSRICRFSIASASLWWKSGRRGSQSGSRIIERVWGGDWDRY